MFDNLIISRNVFDHFTLQELVPWRLVCSEWKVSIDTYLSSVKTLVITEKSWHNACDALEFRALFGLKARKLVKRHLKWKNCHFEHDVTRLLPNIRVLVMFLKSSLSDEALHVRVQNHFLSTWIGLEKVLLFRNDENLNNLKSLNTLCIIDRTKKTTRVEPYLYRLQALCLPSEPHNLVQFTKLKTLAFLDIPDVITQDFLSKKTPYNIIICSHFDFDYGFTKSIKFFQDLLDNDFCNLSTIQFGYFSYHGPVSIESS